MLIDIYYLRRGQREKIRLSLHNPLRFLGPLSFPSLTVRGDGKTLVCLFVAQAFSRIPFLE